MLKNLKWEIKNNLTAKNPLPATKDIIAILLDNRGLKTIEAKQEFLNPVKPGKLELKELGLSEKSVNCAIQRLKKAKKNKEKIVIYGDYDTDGICATAILWECLYGLSFDIIPYIPNRFEEGYGINSKSISQLITNYPQLKLIITVDNGIVANEAVDTANQLGIDVVITDHHQKGSKIPRAFSIIHTDKISGSGIAWLFSREIEKVLTPHNSQLTTHNSLELAALGTIADQIPLLGPNRSIVKYGLEELRKTARPGLLALFTESAVEPGSIGTYEVNYMIAPRLNAMGRLEHAIDSLRLLCTKNSSRARELAQVLGKTNKERQKIVDEVVGHARELATKKTWQGAIVVAHESYHEGVIGLAAAKLVEEFYRPAIVISKGKKYSKASARSIAGFNIIESIKKLDSLLAGGGGHPMAAGFTIATEKIAEFIREFEKVSSPLLSNELLVRRLKVDLEINFSVITNKLSDTLAIFEPTGLGNPTPAFATMAVNLIDVRSVGTEGKHLKLALENNGKIFPAIAFGFGNLLVSLKPGTLVDVVYTIDKNVWNGNETLQLKVKDIKLK
jgi:single-stranded-DNA-specific exonuclease